MYLYWHDKNVCCVSNNVERFIIAYNLKTIIRIGSNVHLSLSSLPLASCPMGGCAECVRLAGEARGDQEDDGDGSQGH